MIDFLHLHKISLDYYQQIKLPKLLLISKLDSIPKCLKKEKIKSFLWDHYQIKDVYFVQKNSQSSLKRIINQIEKTKENNIYFAGLTNAGKSTLLNNLFPQKKITTSELPNTTVGFFKVGSIHEKNIFDTPGIGERALENIETIKKQNVEKEIRPRTYPFKNTASLIIDDSVRISLKEPGNLTWFSSDKIKMIKVYEKNNKLKEAAKIIVSVPKETNVHIKNLGFIYLKKEN